MTSSQQQQQTSLPGRVVRLHFTCVAELPIGSFLRVTGSTLWAPGVAATDPAGAEPVLGRTESSAFPVSASEMAEVGAHSPPHHGNYSALYTSSVPMVTTPETYPVWKTQKPVIVMLNRHGVHRKTVQHHYYRYLVVSPGGGTDETSLTAVSDEFATTVVSTSSEFTGSTAVLQWEDPFGTLSSHHTAAQQQQQQQQQSSSSNMHASTSTASLLGPSSMMTTRADYRNLPYRTLDIHVGTAAPVEAVYDHWNSTDDASFQPYRIREAIHEENRRKLQPQASYVTDVNMDDNDEDDDDAMMDVANDPTAAINASSTASEAVPVLPPRPVRPTATTSATTAGSSPGTPPAFSTNNRIFFVCFHLPVVVVQSRTTGEWEASWSESILAKTEGSKILSTYQGFWVGTVTTHPPFHTDADREKIRALLEEMKCIPIFLDAAVRQSHYYGFCKQVLWPAFHNIDLLDLSTCGWLLTDSSNTAAAAAANDASDWDQSRLDDWWNAFNTVNQEFSNKMSSLLKVGDIVWIHDYHLSLLPEMLTAWELEKFGCKVTRKVFFLHIPFPTSQIFRELECGESILHGILHADVVGFHAFDHARHFLNAAKRILGLNYESLAGGLIGVSFQGSTVLVSMSNVSIEPRMVDAALMIPSVQINRDALKEKHRGKTILGGLDIGQRLSGATLKLLAYERLLQDYPSWKKHVVMVQRILLPGSRKKDEDLTQREVRALVKRIQEKFGPEVIDYQELVGTSMPMDQRLALWKATDILMCTPIREGLNHWPLEYIYAHKDEAPGIVITSEFSAVSSILNGALRVNPYDIQMTITTIDKALSMDRQEREGRRYRDIDFVSNSPSDRWVLNVLRDLRDATNASSRAGGSESNSQAATPYATPNPSKKLLADSTAAFMAREDAHTFSHLHLKSLKKAFDATKRRVIILDFNGTIVLKEPPGKYLKREILGTSGNKPPPDVIDALQKLCADPKNTVYVVSGDSSENVLSALGHLHGLGLAVSNGACFSPPLQNPATERRRWLTFDLGVDWDAVKRVALPVLSKYTARSNGSFVKLTSFSIGWSYYSCDPEWGSLQAAHLVLELENELRAFDVRFVTLKGIVEIVPRRLNKGLIVKRVLHDTAKRQDLEGESVDFALCFGDDISDEKMFTSVFTFMAELGDEANSDPGPPVFDERRNFIQDADMDMTDSNLAIPDPQYCFTVAVGKKPTHASSYVNDAQEVANALVMLAQGEIPEGGVPLWDRDNATAEMFT